MQVFLILVNNIKLFIYDMILNLVLYLMLKCYEKT